MHLHHAKTTYVGNAQRVATKGGADEPTLLKRGAEVMRRRVLALLVLVLVLVAMMAFAGLAFPQERGAPPQERGA